MYVLLQRVIDHFFIIGNFFVTIVFISLFSQMSVSVHRFIY